MTHNNSIGTMFGITKEQSVLLFSLERYLVIEDIKNTSSAETKILKENWLEEWVKVIEQSISVGEEKSYTLIDNYDELVKSYNQELNIIPVDTWYYLVLLEAVTFTGYIPLGISEDKDKVYAKLSYEQLNETIQAFVNEIGVGNEDIIQRFYTAYKSSLADAQGSKSNWNKLFAVVAGAGIAAAAAAVAAPQIAIALFGAKFAGLGGAALVNACLAFAGGGAIAAGGLGIGGGVFAIVGGGALLGAAGGASLMAGFSTITKSNPDFAFSQAAKMSVVLKEIILNEQHDIIMAQEVMNLFREQILNLQRELGSLRLEQKMDKQAIENLTKAIEGLERQYKENIRFSSSFEEGLKSLEEESNSVDEDNIVDVEVVVSNDEK